MGWPSKEWSDRLQRTGHALQGNLPAYQAAQARERESRAYEDRIRQQGEATRRKELEAEARRRSGVAIYQANELMKRGDVPGARKALGGLMRPLQVVGTPEEVEQLKSTLMAPDEAFAQSVQMMVGMAGQSGLFDAINDKDARGRMGETGQLVQRKLQDGSVQYGRSIPIYDAETNTVSNQFVPLGDDTVPVNDMGLTPQAMVGYTRDKAGAAQTGKDQSIRTARTIDEGIAAARGMPVLRRTRSLLEKVKTGGINKWKLDISNMFGVTGADEGELSANLGRAVLGQLKQIFGAQFTEREGERLEGIEAGFGKSTAANVRLIESLMQIAEQEAALAIEAATLSGDEAAIRKIDSFMGMTLGDSSGAPVVDARAPGQSGRVTITNIRRGGQ